MDKGVSGDEDKVHELETISPFAQSGAEIHHVEARARPEARKWFARCKIDFLRGTPPKTIVMVVAVVTDTPCPGAAIQSRVGGAEQAGAPLDVRA